MKSAREKLLSICYRADITYTQLARLLQVTPNTVKKWIGEVTRPKKLGVEKINRLAATSTSVIRKRLSLPPLKVQLPKEPQKPEQDEPIEFICIDWPIVYTSGQIFCVETSCVWRRHNKACPFKGCIKRK